MVKIIIITYVTLLLLVNLFSTIVFRRHMERFSYKFVPLESRFQVWSAAIAYLLMLAIFWLLVIYWWVP